MAEVKEQAPKIPSEAQEVTDRWNVAIGAHLNEIRGIPLTPDDLIGRFIMYAGVLIQAYHYESDILAALLNVAARANLGYQKLEGTAGRKDN